MAQFEFIKEIDLIQLIDKDLGKGESTGKWTKYDCPFCKHIRRDSKKYLLVTNGTDKLGSWFVCKFCNKRGDALVWLEKYRKMNITDALVYLRGPYVQKRNAKQIQPHDG